MTKVLLTNPRFVPNKYPPLGIAYLAAFLRENGVNVEILDPVFEGLYIAEKRLRNPDYDILAVSTLTMNFEDGLKMAKIAKEANPNCITIFGGIHSTIFPEEVIKNKEVDVVCIGEGEYTLLELVQQLEKNRDFEGIRGTILKTVKNPPRPPIQKLDDIPFPARDLLPMKDYLFTRVGRVGWELRSPSTSMITSRGCYFRCTFCSSHLLFGRKVRFRSAKNVVDEIEHLCQDYNIKGISFVDDTFAQNLKRIKDISSEIIKRKLDIEWICMGRVDTVSKEMLKEMKKAGCVGIGYGIESGSQHILDNYIKKGINLNQVENAIKITREVGLTSVAYFMMGTPGETIEDIKKTIEFAKKLNTDAVNFTITIPMPGTELYDIANKIGKIEVNSLKDFDYSNYPIFESPDLPKYKVHELHKNADREYYFRTSYLLNQILSIKSRPKSAIRILRWIFNRWRGS